MNSAAHNNNYVKFARTENPASVGPVGLIRNSDKAHARRKYYDVYVMDRSPVAARALERIGELYAIERGIRGQLPEARAAVRRMRSAPVLSDLRAWLSSAQRTLSAKSPLAVAIQYTLTRWSALTRYMADGRIEVDNNAAERAIRALVLGRRNYLVAGSDAGGDTAARLYMPLEQHRPAPVPSSCS